jgi:branched-chain amino acid transport system ATP-binding protein
MPVFEAIDISVAFGALRAVDGVSVGAEGGSLVGLIGPNGAGKTTFVDAVTGFTPCRGRVVLDGRDLTNAAPHERVRAGLSRTWQGVELFDDLTVAENVMVAAPRHKRDNRRAEQFLDEVRIADLAGRNPRELSHGQRTLVGVARALATSPRLLCLDEPAAGLDPAESDALGKRLRAIADRGVSILLIDHDMSLVLSCCDDIYVVDFGTVIAQGAPQAIRTDARVIDAYLGTGVSAS